MITSCNCGVDGVAVYTAENSAVIPIAPELGLTKDSEVSVIVRDAAGNSAEQALEVQMVAPIVVEERETFNAPFGAEDAIELTITSEPGVDLEIEIQGNVYRMEDNAGRGRYTLTNYIPEGRKRRRHPLRRRQRLSARGRCADADVSDHRARHHAAAIVGRTRAHHARYERVGDRRQQRGRRL